MDLELTDEQRELRDVARGMLGGDPPLAYARGRIDGQEPEPTALVQMAELGWYEVGLGDDDPFGLAGLCLLAEQVGANLAPSLLVDAAIVARVAAAAEADDLLASVTAGDPQIALGWLDADGDWGLEHVTATADSGTVSGSKIAVRHGKSAGAFAIVALSGGEPGLYVVEAGATGLEVTDDLGIDPSLAPVALELDGVAVAHALEGAEVAAALGRGALLGAVASAAEACGAAASALELAVAYALERKQFGGPIGSFQAVQHILADAHILIESSWATTFYAAAALDESLAEADEAAAIAAAHVSRSAREAVEATMQAFGGIGFTWEHDLHLLLRRVLECQQRFGDSLHHEWVLADELADRARSAQVAA